MKLTTYFILLTFLIACNANEMEFDQEKWNKQIDGTYQYRENMVRSLMENHLRKGMTYGELIELIGLPTNYGNIKKNTIGYEIMVDYQWNIDPMEGKTLYFELANDSAVKNYRLKHWEHGK